MTELEQILSRLTAAAASFAVLSADARSDLARSTACRVADVAERWIDAAVALKGGGGSVPQAVAAEETATGPIATLRLLLITARAWREIGQTGVPRVKRLEIQHASGPGSFVALDVLPEPGLFDGTIFQGTSGIVRCVDPGGLDAFRASWRREAESRPRSGGVAVVLGAGNVTGLGPADAIDQIFGHGRGVLLKLHPLHAPLRRVVEDALAPLIEAGLLAIVVGDAEFARVAVAAPAVTHVHLTGGQATFDAIVWGPAGPRPNAEPVLGKAITCELGNVTPWCVVPGRYTPRQLRFQAELVAGSIANNSSFNCIATKCVVTCRGWPQREEFLRLVAGRLGSLVPRPAWFPGAAAAWEDATGLRIPADGSLPWTFLTGCDPDRDRRLLAREWFVPVATEVPLDAGDIEVFCCRAAEFSHSLPGSLAASVTIPGSLSAADAARTNLFVEHLRYGVVAVNTWSAIAYTLGSVPWGGYPGATLLEPASGIGRVHDPLLLPLVHNAILRAPLASRLPAAWLPWHPQGERLARGLLRMYSAIARGRRGLGQLIRMVPAVLSGSLAAPAPTTVVHRLFWGVLVAAAVIGRSMASVAADDRSGQVGAANSRDISSSSDTGRPTQETHPGLPNIVIVFVDDMGWSDVSAFDSDRVETEHIDRLTAEGTVIPGTLDCQAVACSVAEGGQVRESNA
jgi:acyl-CoA reductase-like NAD-dependent aldehyde dehydrogenase